MRTTMFLSLAAALIAAAPASANENAVSVEVVTDDLDLSSPTDTKQLQKRLVRAARIVCESYGMRGTQAFAAFTECRADALRKARLSAIAAATGRGTGAVRVARR